MDEFSRILIVDDERYNIKVLTDLLREDYKIMAAKTGEQALNAAQGANPPDLILLDIMMPGLDGYEVCKRLKADSRTMHIPVIFVTALDALDDEAKGFETGAVDYITKPFKPVIVKARVRTHLALKKMRENLRAKNIVLGDQVEEIREKTEKLKDTIEQLNDSNQKMEEDQKFAQKVFANIINPKSLNAINIKYILSSMSIFNGDLLLVEKNLSGGQTIMLGDFTGHGLRAALGAIPVVGIFRTMLRKGFSMEEIVFEINQKLNNILPTGIFCCACFIEIDIVRNKLKVWNGGLPALLIHRENRGIIAQVKSSHPPLGILGPAKFANNIEIVDIKPNDRIYIYSDGIIECENQSQELFGQERLEKCFMDNNDPDRLFDEIMESVSAFSAGHPQSDDITIIEVYCPFPEDDEVEDLDKPKDVYINRLDR